MKYPQPTDRYNCSILCANFMEIDERLNSHAADIASLKVGGSGVCEFLSLKDSVTGKVYKLFVTDGKLAIQEVVEND